MFVLALNLHLCLTLCRDFSGKGCKKTTRHANSALELQTLKLCSRGHNQILIGLTWQTDHWCQSVWLVTRLRGATDATRKNRQTKSTGSAEVHQDSTLGLKQVWMIGIVSHSALILNSKICCKRARIPVKAAAPMKMNEEEEWCNHSRNETRAISVTKLHYALALIFSFAVFK